MSNHLHDSDLDPIALPLSPDRRQTAWQKHGSWILLGVSCLIFTGVGVQIGLTIGWSNLQTIMAMKNDEAERSRNAYVKTNQELIEANRQLTDKLAKAVLQSSNAASTAASTAEEAVKNTSPK